MAVRVLLADGDEADRLVLHQCLVLGNCEVAAAADGAEALALATAQSFDLLVLADDLTEPGLGAVAAAAAPLGGEREALLAVISNRPRDAIAGEHPALRVTAAFRRPVDGTALLQQIDRWFSDGPAELPALSLDKLLEDIGGDEALLLELAQTFVMELLPRMDLLDAALAAGDRAEVRRVAHLIKGSSASFGAPALAAAAAVAEEVAVAGSDDLTGPVGAMKQAAEQVTAAVGEFCSS